MTEENKQPTRPKTIQEVSTLELKAAAFDLQQQLQQIMAELQAREAGIRIQHQGQK